MFISLLKNCHFPVDSLTENGHFSIGKYIFRRKVRWTCFVGIGSVDPRFRRNTVVRRTLPDGKFIRPAIFPTARRWFADGVWGVRRQSRISVASNYRIFQRVGACPSENSDGMPIFRRKLPTDIHNSVGNLGKKINFFFLDNVVPQIQIYNMHIQIQDNHMLTEPKPPHVVHKSQRTLLPHVIHKSQQT